MSETPETAPNGFTAVNDGGMANLAVKALNHKDWTNSNGDSPNGYTSYPNPQPKRRIGDIDDSGDEARQPPPPPGLNGSRPTDSTEIDPRTGQAHAAASRDSNGNGFMDELKWPNCCKNSRGRNQNQRLIIWKMILHIEAANLRPRVLLPWILMPILAMSPLLLMLVCKWT
jgi:hypothetical protein